MQIPTGSEASAPSGDQHEGYRSIISNLMSLVEHVRTNVELIDLAIARETHLGDQDTTNIVVLDDLTPRYIEASAALNTCEAYLGVALRFLLDPEASKHEAEGHGESDPRPSRQGYRR